MKLNKTEQAAYRACKHIREGEGEYSFNIVWKRSATWGHNPNVYFGDEVVARASGCGYDKESAALADFLRFLFDYENGGQYILARSGCGYNSLSEALAEKGYILTKTYSGKHEDGYTIRKA